MNNAISEAHEVMLASQEVLAKEWDTPEEDEAWAYLEDEEPPKESCSTPGNVGE